MSDRKAVIKNADMNEEMQQDAVDFATQALEKFNIEKVRHGHRANELSPRPINKSFPVLLNIQYRGEDMVGSGT